MQLPHIFGFSFLALMLQTLPNSYKVQLFQLNKYFKKYEQV